MNEARMTEVNVEITRNTNGDISTDGHSKQQLLQQIGDLQEAVNDMKVAFTTAIQQLGSIQYDDQGLREKVEQNKVECQDQISEVIKLMLTLKAEFGTVKNQVQQIQETQNNFQHQIQSFLFEQDLLLDELCKTGSISDQIRQCLLHSRLLTGRASSGTQSNDSGVALLLEKAHSAIQPFSFPTPSDQDSVSIPENSPVLVSSMVHDYVAGLGLQSNYDSETHNTNYDSDSSLVIAANKSLSLSTSLGKQCGLELDHMVSSEEETDVQDDSVLESLTQKNVNIVQQFKRLNLSKGFPENVEVPESKSFDTSGISSKKLTTHSTINTRNRKNVQHKHYRENQRFRITREILETEKKYCKTLWTIQDTFAEPLKRSGILSLKDINTLFPEEVYQLYEKHCMLLHKLEERVSGWKWHGYIGDIFIKFTDPEESDVLRLYTSYVNDFPEVLKTFHKLCRQSSNFAKFLKTSLDHPSCGGLDLGSYLLTPVQQIPYYVLLLKQMLKYTDADHADFNYISLCLNRLREFLNRLNDTMEHSFQLVTAQISPQSEMDHSHLTRCNKPAKQLKLARQSISAEESFDDCNEDILFEDDDCQLQDDDLALMRTLSKESLTSEKDHNIYRKNNKLNSTGSQQSLKQPENTMNAACSSNVTVQPGSKGPCRAKVWSRAHSESIVSTSTSNSDSPNFQSWNGNSAHHPQKANQRSFDGFRGHSGPQVNWCDNQISEENNNIKTAEPIAIDITTKKTVTEMDSLLQEISKHDDDDDEELDDYDRLMNKNLYSSSVPSKSYMDMAVQFSCKSMQDVKQDSPKLLNKDTDAMCSEPNLQEESRPGNSNSEKNLYQNCLENGSSCNSIVQNQPISKTSFSNELSSPQRPLVKAHSAHAVHQILKEQGKNCVTQAWCDNPSGCDKKTKEKNGKSEKKKVSLRTLKSILFFKKRSSSTTLVKDIGISTEQDLHLAGESKQKKQTSFTSSEKYRISSDEGVQMCLQLEDTPCSAV